MNSFSTEQQKSIGQQMRNKVLKEYALEKFIKTREKLYESL